MVQSVQSNADNMSDGFEKGGGSGYAYLSRGVAAVRAETSVKGRRSPDMQLDERLASCEPTERALEASRTGRHAEL